MGLTPVRCRSGTMRVGASPMFSDAPVTPQPANARRFGARGNRPRITAIAARCAIHPAFIAADVCAQADAE